MCWLLVIAMGMADPLVDADCHRCHDVPGVAPAPRVESCSACHAWIRAVAADPPRRERARAVFPRWDRYEKVNSYLAVPNLEAAMQRLEPAWVRSYLEDPHDLRPGMDETMPRFSLADEELDAILARFEPTPVPATPAPDPVNVARGQALFFERGCAGCHAMGGLHPVATVAGAPDLAGTRARMNPDRVAAWIADPKTVAPTATMPSLSLAPEEVIALRDFLFLADPGWQEASPLPPPPAPTSEPVSWTQVEERVFGKICVHCHMNPENNQGRAGPGNAGGFGWPATGIELETIDGVRAAGPLLADALLRRREEAHRDKVSPGESPAVLTRPEKPGMPLGLPPLSDEDLSLVLGWIAQGMPE